jgi:hypothetical protein
MEMRIKRGHRLRLFQLLVLCGVSAFAPGVFAQAPSPSPTPAGLIGGAASTFTTYDEKTLRQREFIFSRRLVPGEVKTERLISKLMGREMPYRIVLPDGYSTDSSSKRYPVIYLLHGLTGHYDKWTDKTKLASLPTGGNTIIVTPEGEDGWYTDSAAKPNDKYESYIIKELIPEIDTKFRTIADRDNSVDDRKGYPRRDRSDHQYYLRAYRH